MARVPSRDVPSGRTLIVLGFYGGNGGHDNGENENDNDDADGDG